MRLGLIFVSCAILVGCQDKTVSFQPRPESSAPAAHSPFAFRTVNSFERGQAKIALGMTKDNVLAQIAKSGLPDFEGRYGLPEPDPEMRTSDTWTLRYGNMSGAAPGAGEIRIEFSGGKVSALQHRHLPVR